MRLLSLISLSFYLMIGSVFAQDNQQLQDTEIIKVQDIADGFHLLQGQGGNILVYETTDGLYVIDSDVKVNEAPVKAALENLYGSEGHIEYLINTHWHYDHIGGNEILATGGASIIAHDNVRTRMRNGGNIAALDRTIEPANAKALPVMTFDHHLNLYDGDKTVRIMHFKNAHTDGDSVVYFPDDNILHTGDIYFNGLYPFIDTSSGGSIEGVTKAVAAILPMINDETKIIPGHGSLSNKAELQEYLDMLTTVHGRLKIMIEEGKSRNAVIAANPTMEFDTKWGEGFLPPQVWIGILYDSLTQ